MTKYAKNNTTIQYVGFGGHALNGFVPLSTERYVAANTTTVLNLTPPPDAIYWMANFYGVLGFKYTFDGVTEPDANVGFNATGGNLMPIKKDGVVKFLAGTAGNVLCVTWFGTV